jgi:hypothetical protein
MKSLDITDIYPLGNAPLVKQLTVKDFTPNSLGVIDNDVLSDYKDAMITDSIILESILN